MESNTHEEMTNETIETPSIEEIETLEASQEIEEDDDNQELQGGVSEETQELKESEELSVEEDDFNLELDYFDEEKQEDKLWQARTGLNTDTLCGAIETIVFMSDKPVPLARIRKLIDEDMPLRVIHEAISRLQNEYESSHHGLRLLEVAQGYQFRTKATFSKYVQELFKVSSLVLSPTALEVLAIIAYKQPVSKIEVEKIRGVDSSHIVRALMDKRLVRVSGRSEEAGRPVLYSTTPEFLEVFNLADLDQLPPEHELEALVEENKVGKISEIKTIVHSGDKTSFVFDEVDELDELSESIKAIKSDTLFTKSLSSEERKRKNSEGEEVKSAFDLLEEYLANEQVKEGNLESKESHLMIEGVDPSIISDLTAGPFNVPEVDDFEMIDLETGEALVEEPVEMLEEDTKANDDLIELFDTSVTKEEQLAKDLDDAFAKLTGEKLEEVSEIFNELEEDQIELKEAGIDSLTDEMISKANDLDIDLNFLENEVKDESSEDDSKFTE